MGTIVLSLLTPSFAFFFHFFFSRRLLILFIFFVYSKTTHFSTYVKCSKCEIERERKRAPDRFFFLNDRFHTDERSKKEKLSLYLYAFYFLSFFDFWRRFFLLALFFFLAVLPLRSFLLSHLIFVFCVYFHNRPTGN